MPSKTWLYHLLRTTAFLLVLLLAVSLTGIYLKPHSNRYLTGYTAGGILGEDFDTIDVLALGDSNAAQGISPMEWYNDYGITGYTYGVGWFSVFNAYYRLKSIYEEQSPRVLILGAGIIYSKKDNETHIQCAVGDIMDELLPLVRFHDNWKYLTPKNLFEEHDYTWKDVNKGFMPLTNVGPFVGGDYMVNDAAAPIDPLVRFYLDRIVSLCEAHDTQILLVTVPAASWNMARHKGAAAYAAEMGIPYLDYNLPDQLTNLNFNWATDTPDYGDHLNVLGAVKVSNAIGQYLNDHYELADHRGQTGYEDWDNDLNSFLELKEKQMVNVQKTLAESGATA